MLHFARWKAVLILLVTLIGIGYTSLNFLSPQTLSRFPSWLPHNQIVLGLDLQGGVHLLWEVDTASVVENRLKTLRDDVRQTLRDARADFGTDVAGWARAYGNRRTRTRTTVIP